MRNELGTSLFEILISILLLAIVLLEIDAMQIMSLQKAKVNYYFAVATQQLNNMTERLSLTKNINDDWLVGWKKQNQEILPSGTGTIDGSYPNYEIAVFWGNVHAESCRNNKIAQNGCVHRTLSLEI